ncbi:hypothetical protein V9T40_007450 [Parthenolecanium corni]|uniref:Uncharacterized protein n=1 Tax=Parthenolecanium corni TaxID=536013 RepID=A0AAN9TXG1_9HEMI
MRGGGVTLDSRERSTFGPRADADGRTCTSTGRVLDNDPSSFLSFRKCQINDCAYRSEAKWRCSAFAVRKTRIDRGWRGDGRLGAGCGVWLMSPLAVNSTRHATPRHAAPRHQGRRTAAIKEGDDATRRDATLRPQNRTFHFTANCKPSFDSARVTTHQIRTRESRVEGDTDSAAIAIIARNTRITRITRESSRTRLTCTYHTPPTRPPYHALRLVEKTTSPHAPRSPNREKKIPTRP